MVIFKGEQYYVSDWAEYCKMLYEAGEYELEQLTQEFVKDDEAEIRYLEDRVSDLEMDIDGAGDSFMCIYNDVEELIDYVRTAKKLDRKQIITMLQSIMEETGR